MSTMRWQRAVPALVRTAVLGAAVAVFFPTPDIAAPLGPAGQGARLAAHVDGHPQFVAARPRRARAARAFAAGALPGGVITSHPSGHDFGFPPHANYSPAYPISGPYSPVDAAVSYCSRRFRSYDLVTGTYRGYDGNRHACP